MNKTGKTARTESTQRDDATPNVTFIPGAAPVRRKRRTRSWLWVPVVLAVVGAGYYGWTRYATTPTAAAMVTQAVARGDIENSVTAVGTLDAIKSVDAGAQVSGQLKALHVDIGDKVEPNQLVAEIDPATIENRIEIDQAELSNLEAQLISKKAQLVLKQANIDRQRNLVAVNSIAQSTLDQAVADLAAAEADVNAIEAQIRKAAGDACRRQGRSRLHQDLCADGWHHRRQPGQGRPDAERQPDDADDRHHRRSLDHDREGAGV